MRSSRLQYQRLVNESSVLKATAQDLRSDARDLRDKAEAILEKSQRLRARTTLYNPKIEAIR